MEDLLAGVRLKVKRGRRHLDELERAISTWVALQNQQGRRLIETEEPRIEGRGKGARRATRVKSLLPFPPSWGLMAGDGIHNTRCALDHLACALARLNEAKSVNTNSFPIYPDTPDEDRLMKMRDVYLANLRPEHREAIMDMQPYLGRSAARDRRLTSLQTLDNDDKHQVVTAVGAVAKNARGEEMPDEMIVAHRRQIHVPRVKFPPVGTVLEVGEKAWESDVESHVVKMPFQVGIVFGRQRIARRELLKIHDEVARIVEDFAPEFADPSSA